MTPKFVKFLFYNAQAFVKLLVLYSILNVTSINNIYADDDSKSVLDTIIDTLTGLTCETQGVGDLLRTEFSHTCIPAPFFTVAIANIISPGLYANTMLRLKINDHELFNENLSPGGYRYPDGQCSRMNKVDYKEPVLEFALCNNIKLAVVRVEAVAASAYAIAKAVLTGQDPWNDIATAWKSDKAKYHNFYKGKDGDKITMVDVGVIPVFPIKVVKIKDTLCVASPTITADWAPIGCKYMTEPFPDSIYKSFASADGVVHGSNHATDPMAIVDCGVGKSSCYQRAYENSKTAIVISAPIIECIKEMTARLLVSNEVCTFDDIKLVINSNKRESSILFQFQRNMHRTVTALLTLYVMFFGAKIILSGDVPPKNEMINFILKMIFVIYFSVGININPSGGNTYGRLDGMVQWAFPLLLGGIDTLAGWVMNASPSGLCKFNDVVYHPKLSYMALWDALDCRVAHYLGLDIISTLLVESASHVENLTKGKFDFFSFSAPPYVYLLIPAIISGNMTLVSLALSYPLLVISVGAFLINATVMCIVSIVILGALAPLFVPMLLFEYTRGYFESWVKLLISFLLQPMVVTTFMIMMFSVYDFGFYGQCQYKSKSINSIEGGLIRGNEGKRKVKIFFIDNDWNKYSPADVKSCKNSLGYILNNPTQTLFDFAKDSVEEMVVEKPGATSTDKFLAKFHFLRGIVMGPAMFFVSPKILFEKIRDIVLALITACFTLYLIYHFSAQLAEFAADMTEGVALNNVTIKPQAIFKAGMAAISAAGGAMKGGDLQAAGGGQQAGDLSAAGEGGEAEDSASIDSEAPDIATGGGSGGGTRRTLSTATTSPARSSENTAVESVSSIGKELPVQRGSDNVTTSSPVTNQDSQSLLDTPVPEGLPEPLTPTKRSAETVENKLESATISDSQSLLDTPVPEGLPEPLTPTKADNNKVMDTNKGKDNNFGLIHGKPYPLPKSPQQEWEEKKRIKESKQEKSKDGSDENT
ncbi:MAG: type IV secretion system protein [Rickettsia endosymbiont of Bryobia graminum]|nr:type IV secretion system protein [Rickettsia endosymbiont of Bryobia graminum]